MPEKLPPKILVIEHDEILNSICNTIERHWFDVKRVKSAEEDIKVIETAPPNLVVISSRLKSISSMEMMSKIRKIKELKTIPIVFLIDKGELAENYKIADNHLIDVVYRPFTPNELISSIKSLIRRSNPIFQDKIIRYSDIGMDRSTFKVYKGNRSIHLGRIEFKILELFVEKPEKIYSRRQIIDHVWGKDKEMEPRTIDVHINKIRTSIKNNSNDGVSLIKTIRSKGYTLA